MTEEEIIALAREYADFTDTSDVEKKFIGAICENFLKYMLRRFPRIKTTIQTAAP